jgi:hydroxylamine reductase
MFCFQCQETAKNVGCQLRQGVCGKPEKTARLQDLLIYTLKGIAIYGEKAGELGISLLEAGRFTAQSLFATITNANFDEERFSALIQEALGVREDLRRKFLAAHKEKTGEDFTGRLHDAATWSLSDPEEFQAKAADVGVLSTENEDVRSLREMLIIGLKGICAYAEHAAVLGHEDEEIYSFVFKGLASTTRELGVEEMVDLVMKAGETAVRTMALLDKANTSAYGSPEITAVSLEVRDNPGILVSGHDLRDMADLLKQTDGTGVDVYTHGEMLPANTYPAFKKYKHLVGNYGGSWWKQGEEFEAFNGPILMTTNCLVPVKDAYRDRIFTTGIAGYPGVKHIPDREGDKPKDFSEIIELAKQCPPPKEIEQGTLVGGFGHNQVLSLADKVIEAIQSGAVKRFIVMAGCDGRQGARSYYTEVAKELPKDTVILTAGCAKYRYNKLDLGEIGGIPRVLDAGQCNDSYSLALVALKLKEVFGLEDINDLPISYDIAWYEQKAVAVLLALLSLGVKGIRLGPTLPGFLSPNVAKVLVERFGIRPIGEAGIDISDMLSEK